MAKRKLILTYGIHQFLHWLIVGLMMPIFSLFQIARGLNLFQIGITMSVYSGIIIFLELPTGGLADSIGRKKVYMFSRFFSFLSVLIILFTHSFYGVLCGFLFMGVGRALSSGSLDAWFIDEYNKIDSGEGLQKAIATIGIFVPSGLVMGSLIGGIIPDALGPYLVGVFNFDRYSSVFLIISIFIILESLYTIIFIKELPDSHLNSRLGAGLKRIPEIFKDSIQYGLKNNIVLKLLLTTVALGFAFSGLENYWQPKLQSLLGHDFSTNIFGLLSASYFFAAVIGNVLITPLCRLFNKNYSVVLFFSRLIMGLLWVVLARQTSVLGFSIFYVVLFFFNGLQSSPHLTILNAQIPTSKRSTLLSFESLMQQLGAVIGALIMGFIAKQYSISMAWYFGSGILVLSSFLYLRIPRDSKKRSFKN